MALRNTNTDFGALAKWLHWLVNDVLRRMTVGNMNRIDGTGH